MQRDPSRYLYHPNVVQPCSSENDSAIPCLQGPLNEELRRNTQPKGHHHNGRMERRELKTPKSPSAAPSGPINATCFSEFLARAGRP